MPVAAKNIIHTTENQNFARHIADIVISMIAPAKIAFALSAVKNLIVTNTASKKFVLIIARVNQAH